MMSSRSRSAGLSNRGFTVLVALAATLVAVFVVGPPKLAAGASGAGYADEHDLAEAFREASVEYWRSGDRDFSAMLAVLSLAVVMANIQGVVAPFASLLPMLADGAADKQFADTLAQVTQPLAAPALAALFEGSW